jgi:hypothetical protein
MGCHEIENASGNEHIMSIELRVDARCLTWMSVELLVDAQCLTWPTLLMRLVDHEIVDQFGLGNGLRALLPESFALATH